MFIAFLLLPFLHAVGHPAVTCRNDFLVYTPLSARMV